MTGPSAGGAPIDVVYDGFGRRVSFYPYVFVYDQSGRILEVSNRAAPPYFFGDLVWVENELLGRVEDDVTVGTMAWVPPAARRWLPEARHVWLVWLGAGGTLLLLGLALRPRDARWGTAAAALALVLIAGLACVPTGVAFYWVVTDHLGTPIAMTNTPTSGEPEVIWKASYTPFGHAIADIDPDGDGTAVRMPVRFPGQWWDYGTGLHYNLFRDYDPKTGRYLEADPAGQFGFLRATALRPRPGSPRVSPFGSDARDANLFAYARSAPTNVFDPDGNGPKELVQILVSLIVVGVTAARECFLSDDEGRPLPNQPDLPFNLPEPEDDLDAEIIKDLLTDGPVPGQCQGRNIPKTERCKEMLRGGGNQVMSGTEADRICRDKYGC